MAENKKDYKVLIIPGELNNTPYPGDLLLVMTHEEFLKMWERGWEMLQKGELKEEVKKFELKYFAGSN